jgi:hypothetical protein
MHAFMPARARFLVRNTARHQDAFDQDGFCARRTSSKAQIVAGWTIQPDFQNIFHPGGELSIHLILLSGGSPTPPFLHCAPRSVFRAA